jgi:hypothetical protein
LLLELPPSPAAATSILYISTRTVTYLHPLLQLIDGKVFHPLIDGELIHPLQQLINGKQGELIYSLASPSSCNCSILHFC